MESQERQLQIFYSHLARLLEAGARLPMALRELVAGAQTPAFAKVLTKLATMVEDGDALAAAMARFPAWFELAYLPLVERAAELEELPEMLRELADLAGLSPEPEGDCAAFHGGILAATAAVLAVAAGVSCFALRRLATQVVEMRGFLPLPTRLLFGLLEFCGNWSALVLALPVVPAAMGFRLWQGRRNLPGFYLLAEYLPGLAGAVRHAEHARICLLLAVFQRHDFSLREGLEAAAQTARGERLRRRLRAWAAAAGSGSDLADIIRRDPRADSLLRLALAGTPPEHLAAKLAALSAFYRRLNAAEISGPPSLLPALPVLLFCVFALTFFLAVWLPLTKLIGG